MESKLNQLQTSAIAETTASETLHQLQEVEVKYLGRKSEFTELMAQLKNLPDDQKRIMGPLLNEAKKAVIEHLGKKRSELESKDLAKKLSGEFFDLTLPGTTFPVGHIHPVSQIQREVENIFSAMGFTIADGPEIESEYYNFEALNIPADHPARDIQDTFFVSDKHEEKHGRLVLRTHTSPVQVRSLERWGTPLRIITPGRVFRNEATDASHDNTFYQTEGMMIDKDISLATLKGVMAEFLTRLFHAQVKVRFRPGYFPFVEPGVELDFSCLLCKEKGCSACKQTGWIEFMGAGMTHPSVLKAANIDPKKYQGWAFGFGLSRLVMMRYGIDDVRLLQSGDLRFLQQF